VKTNYEREDMEILRSTDSKKLETMSEVEETKREEELPIQEKKGPTVKEEIERLVEERKEETAEEKPREEKTVR